MKETFFILLILEPRNLPLIYHSNYMSDLLETLNGTNPIFLFSNHKFRLALGKDLIKSSSQTNKSFFFFHFGLEKEQSFFSLKIIQNFHKVKICGNM